MSKVKLVNQSNSSESITFQVSIDLSENRSVNYTPVEPTHAPGSMMVFKNSAARTFDLSDVKLVSRNKQEATDNIQALQIIRSWTLPWFGGGGGGGGSGGSGILGQINNIANQVSNIANSVSQIANGIRGITQGFSGGTVNPDKIFGGGFSVEPLGAPPAVLLLSAYSNGRVYTNIRSIPVVINNLNITYPSDVDYIPTENNEPFPTIMSLSISLTEAHSPNEYENVYTLGQFKSGSLVGF